MYLPPRLPSKSDKADQGRRSQAHRAWVRGFQCAVPGCGRVPIECAHVRRASNAGTGIKPSDAYTVALCRDHHQESHTLGEKSFEAKYGLDLMALAKLFYTKSPHKNKLDNPYG